MKKRLFKFTFAAMAAAAVIACAPAVLAANVASGSGDIGESASWSLDSDDATGAYTLTISGTGETQYEAFSAPWSDYQSEINKLVISEGITNVPDCAFAFETYMNLSEVVLPSTITHFGGNAFSDCMNLSSVTIPEGITEIGDGMFMRCMSLSEVILPSTVTYLGNDAFTCTDITEITLPAGLETIGVGVFVDCTNLSSVTIPEGITEIGDGMFMGCESLNSITIPVSVTRIGMDAFERCGLEDGITYTGTTAQFVQIDGIDDLAGIDIHCSDGDYDTSSASGTLNESISWELLDGVLTISGTGDMPDFTSVSSSPWYSKKSIVTKIVVSNGITRIGNYAFGYMSNVNDFDIPDTLASIGNYAFETCYGLKSIVIPEGVTSIGTNAFNYCTKLETVVLPASLEKVGDDIFRGCGLYGKLTNITYNGTRESFNTVDNIVSGLTDKYTSTSYDLSTRVSFAAVNAREQSFDISAATENSDARAYIAEENVNITNPAWKIGVTYNGSERTITKSTGMSGIQGNVIWGAVLYNLDGATINSVTLEGGNE